MRISLFYEYYGGHLGFIQNITCYTYKKKWNPIFCSPWSYSEPESVAKSILTSKKANLVFMTNEPTLLRQHEQQIFTKSQSFAEPLPVELIHGPSLCHDYETYPAPPFSPKGRFVYQTCSVYSTHLDFEGDSIPPPFSEPLSPSLPCSLDPLLPSIPPCP